MIATIGIDQRRSVALIAAALRLGKRTVVMQVDQKASNPPAWPKHASNLAAFKSAVVRFLAGIMVVSHSAGA